MANILVGCCGWAYGDLAEKGGWTGAFYPSSSTKRLPYYSRFFNTVEMDASFYEKFYKYMTPSMFRSMASATPEGFQFSVKVPESITHDKRLNVKQGAIELFEEFLTKISPLKVANKLGAILIQLPPSFTVKEFQKTEQFLDRLPSSYAYAVEFRHPSWETEGPWNMLKHYNISTAMIDSPPSDKLQFLSNVTITANHSFIRFHGRDSSHRYNYLYSEGELKPWLSKIKTIQSEVSVVRSYFNNHYGAKALVNALQLKELLGTEFTEDHGKVLRHAEEYIAMTSPSSKLDKYLVRK
jgi:uncharacterized protein YecE (DUF72 family)